MIRRAEERDLGFLTDLEKELFPDDPWPLKEFTYELHENPYACIYVYEENGKIIGYVDHWILFEQAEIADIGVSYQYQGKGIGRKLMAYCVNRSIEKGCENLTLEVRVSNTHAIALYEKCGFINAAKRRHYYENGEDAYLMVKPLGGLVYDNDSGN